MQAPSCILMIRPVRFGYNEQTAGSNLFQQQGKGMSAAQIQARALEEFDGFVALLQQHDVNVIVFEDTLEPHTPDSIFPNNWISFHEDGTVILYPMFALNRRLERRGDLLVKLQADHRFDIRNIIDLSHFEKQNRYLEGTGSIVFDHVNRIAYANLSVRTDTEVLHKLALDLEYKVVTFDAVHEDGSPIYHANVMMCVGDKFAVICAECIPGAEERRRVVSLLRDTGHEVVEISFAQMNAFAGNVLEIKNTHKESMLIMSQTARNAFSAEQLGRLSKYATLLSPDIGTIEHIGGGSARCMIAGIHLPVLQVEKYDTV